MLVESAIRHSQADRPRHLSFWLRCPSLPTSEHSQAPGPRARLLCPAVGEASTAWPSATLSSALKADPSLPLPAKGQTRGRGRLPPKPCPTVGWEGSGRPRTWLYQRAQVSVSRIHAQGYIVTVTEGLGFKSPASLCPKVLKPRPVVWGMGIRDGQSLLSIFLLLWLFPYSDVPSGEPRRVRAGWAHF